MYLARSCVGGGLFSLGGTSEVLGDSMHHNVLHWALLKMYTVPCLAAVCTSPGMRFLPTTWDRCAE